ncbi:unnamed protein product [Acanthoscelides obtectus]|uniref:Uncharacterized protein n=1 Tax=Acanthoscelides obtectus TaxID=200917 RepID=A0A9P0PCF1_ACAOB|nr:unnamed protein product [Acanthoscelides obtectus]CAK1685078.1 hypothetical protein AOBTE_LOCUS35223 [Acanthoscelides obtectus]
MRFNIHVKMVADKWENGAWEENIYSTGGPFCEMMKKYANKFFTNFRTTMSPQLPEECNYKADEYTLDNFTCSPEDFDVPSMLMGTFKVHLSIFNPEEENIACFVGELEVSGG